MAKGLWQPPQLRSADEGLAERRATWLELFYDLVFVAAIAQLAHGLSGEIGLWGFVEFTFLFIPIWWCWVGATFYATRFDTDDLRDRLLTLLQMAIVAALAVNLHRGLDDRSADFALCYAAIRYILIIQYSIAGCYVRAARPLVSAFVRGFGTGAGLWMLSVFVPLPWRFVLWGLGMMVDLITPLIAGKNVARVPPDMSHIPERLGLFTIIVLGESVAGVVRGVAEQEWGVASALSALLGMSIAFSLWWLYFDTVDGSPLQSMKAGRMDIGLSWVYAHLPLSIGLTAMGVGVEHIVSTEAGVVLSDTERWLFCGSVALCLSILAFIHLITCSLGTTRRRKLLSAYRLGAAAFVLVLGVAGGALPSVVLVGSIAFICAMQVILDSLGKRK